MFQMNASKTSVATALLILATAGCSQEQKSQKPTVQKIRANAEFSGFFKSYSNLKPVKSYSNLTPVDGMEGTALGFASTDAKSNLHRYIAVMIDPVEVYLASDADEAKLTDNARSAVTEYFRAALVKAVSDAYPVVDQAGPLVLRLRAAVVGVDFGGEIAAEDKDADKDKSLTYTVNIGGVKVEMELLDSETGEQIAALVDKESLGSGAEIGSVNPSRQEKWAAARTAFDGWANRIRQFLNVSTELSAADADRANQSYKPYGLAQTPTLTPR